MHHCPWLFHVSFQGETQVLMLIQQALDWSSHLLSPSLKKERKPTKQIENLNSTSWNMYIQIKYMEMILIYVISASVFIHCFCDQKW